MKKCILSLLSIFLLQTIVFAQSSWKSPEYKPEVFRKVMVLAKTSDELKRRQIEDATVKLLIEKGITTIPSYPSITEADIASEETFIIKADALEVDALLVYKITGTNSEYKNAPSVNASIGIPVRMGIFGGFLGTSVPIAGGAKTVNTINATANFYNRSSKSLQWSFALSAKLKKDNSKLANNFALSTVNAMEKDNLFVK
jgi:hypothetical protein